MPHNPIRVVVGPANYFSHPGSLNHLHSFFTDEQLSCAVWIYDEHAITTTQAKLPPTSKLPEVKHILFRGHCSESDVQQLAAESGDDRSIVIDVDDGALLDTAKVLAHRLGLSFITVPTIAATCAAWTPFSVWYNDAGQALHYEIFDDASFVVLVEPKIILNAPQQYPLTGIGDTLTKWYEAVVLAPQPETLPLTVRLRINNAQAIRNVLLNSSEQALSDQQDHQLTQSFCDVVDAVIADGGAVGSLDDRFTRVTAAYAVHSGLIVLPQTRKFLHGTKVTYGILVQSALPDQDDVLAQLTGTYQRFHLPTTLAELEVDINNQAKIDKVIAHTLRPVGFVHYPPVTLTPDTLRAVFEEVKSFRA